MESKIDLVHFMGLSNSFVKDNIEDNIEDQKEDVGTKSMNVVTENAENNKRVKKSMHISSEVAFMESPSKKQKTEIKDKARHKTVNWEGEESVEGSKKRQE